MMMILLLFLQRHHIISCPHFGRRHAVLSRSSTPEAGSMRVIRARQPGASADLPGPAPRRARFGRMASEDCLVGTHSAQQHVKGRALSPLKWANSSIQERLDREEQDEQEAEWEMHVKRALNSQMVSNSWAEIVREKHLVLEAALKEVDKARERAAELVREKAQVASVLEDEYRFYLEQARGELQKHIGQSRAAAELRNKKERAVRREISEALSFSQIRTSLSQTPGPSESSFTPGARGAERGQAISTSAPADTDVSDRDARERELRESQGIDAAIEKVDVCVCVCVCV